MKIAGHRSYEMYRIGRWRVWDMKGKAPLLLGLAPKLGTVFLHEDWTKGFRKYLRDARAITRKDLSRGRRMAKSQRLAAALYGIGGVLAHLLSDSPEDKLLLETWHRKSPAGGPGQRETWVLGSWGGWGGLMLWAIERLQKEQLETNQQSEANLQLLSEIALFSEAGFSVQRCKHGKHYYVSDDRRRCDCLLHFAAGQKRRFRRKKERGR